MSASKIAAGALLALGWSGLALAHHSTAEFDYTQVVRLQGTVTEFRWVNPHSHIGLYVELEDGTAQTWSVECGNPSINSRRGWTSRSIESGDEVELVISPARDGRPYGTLRVMTLADGSQLQGVIGNLPTDENGDLVFGAPQDGGTED